MKDYNIKFSKMMLAGALTILLGACAARESSQKLQIAQTESQQTAARYSGPKRPLVVGRFSNESNYMKGMFSDDNDQLGGQAKTILKAHLQRTNRFSVMDRSIMKELEKEAGYRKSKQKIKGAEYAISGDVTEFGRKDTGDKQLFGIVGSGKKQIAYSKVTLNVVNVDTSEVIFSASGAGEYALSNREVLGFGGSSGYDSTLNGKVLDLAVREAVDRLVEGLERGEWK